MVKRKEKRQIPFHKNYMGRISGDGALTHNGEKYSEPPSGDRAIALAIHGDGRGKITGVELI
jgi:hypothetical protein